MEFLTPGALVALFLLPVLVFLHMRRRRFRTERVSSLLVWREVLGERLHGGKILSLPDLPLLVLQLAVVSAIVIALARPTFIAPVSSQLIVVLDDSIRMSATDVLPNRLTAAKGVVERRIAQAASGTTVTLIAATANPYVLVSSSDLDRVRQALDRLAPAASAANLSSALRLAAGRRSTAADRTRVLLVHALEETVPSVTPSNMLETQSIGINSANQALVHLSVRCDGVARAPCTVFASVRNEDTRRASVPLVIRADGAVLVEQTVDLPALSDTGVSFPLPAGKHVLEAYLASRDILPLDNAAWCIVPSSSAPSRVTIVGVQQGIAPLQRAFAALGNVRVRAMAPARYDAATAPSSDLLVLDGWLPPGGLPSATAVLLINPPSIPGGQLHGTLDDATISGELAGSPLLDGIDLTALDIPANVAQRMTLPTGEVPVFWSATGALFSAGWYGTRQLAILAFEPAKSDLVHLNAFPLLLRNILRWSEQWLPASATVADGIWIVPPPDTWQVTITREGLSGQANLARFNLASPRPITLQTDLPGIYAVGERGSWGSREAQVAVNMSTSLPDANALVPIAIVGTGTFAANNAPTRQDDRSWWPWIGLIALAIMVVEWLFVARRSDR